MAYASQKKKLKAVINVRIFKLPASIVALKLLQFGIMHSSL